MTRRRDGVRWHTALARLALVALLSLVLWAGVVAAPFVLAHALTLHGASARAWTLAAFAASVLGVIAFLCYLMDRT